MSAVVTADIVIGIVIAIITAAALGVALTAALREDKGKRCLGGARHPLPRVRKAARNAAHWLRTGEFLLPPAAGSREPDDGQLLEEWKEAHRLAPAPSREAPADWAAIRAGMPAPVPPHPRHGPLTDTPPRGLAVEVGDQTVIVGGLPGGRGLMRVGCEPWLTAGQPVAPDPEPDGEPVSAARPYVGWPCCAHCEGFVCERPYHETPCDEGCNDAARPMALALGPDGSEEIR